MMIAAMMGALAFQKDLGAAHSMAHPLSSVSRLHHGLANAIVLPYVMEFNREAAESRFARVAALFDPQAVLSPASEASCLAIQKVRAMNTQLGLPASLKEAGVKESDLEALAEGALHDGCHATNPRACTLEDFRALFKQAFAG
jgi:alcohol dehydrogenase class IV